MQGRPDQGNDPWDREATAARLAALNGARANLQGTGKYKALQGTGKYQAISTSTSEHRAIPQRPQHMPPHVNCRPETSRAPRPQRPLAQSRRVRPFLIVLGTMAAIITIIAFVIVFLVVGAINQSAGPAITSADFLGSLYTRNYENAYQDLGPAITLQLGREEFIRQVQALDEQYGKVTDYKEIEGSATVKNDIWSFTYTITREKLKDSYKLPITLQKQDPNDNNSWKIVSYGETLGPPQP